MPLFRRVHRNPDDDSTYAFDSNPDPKQFEPVPEPKSAKSKPAGREAAPESKE